MPLTLDVTNVKNHETVTTHPDNPNQWHPVTQGLMYHMVGIGMGEITDKNAAEVYARIALVESIDGAMLTSREGPQRITPENVQSHIGMRVNVAPVTRARFLKRFTLDLDAKARHYQRVTGE